MLLKSKKSEIENDHPRYVLKDNGKLKDHSAPAKEIRKQVNTIMKEVKQMDEKIKTLNKTINAKTSELKELDKFIDNVKGPFKTKFDDLMNALKLKRQVYHSGALVGNDMDKIYGKTHRKNIIEFANVFTPVQIRLQDATERAFSSHMLKQKFFTLLFKFSQIYKLMMLSRALCRHKVSLLTVRCYSLGNWFPVAFPNENL